MTGGDLDPSPPPELREALATWTVVVTRPQQAEDRLRAWLLEMGAALVDMPTIAVDAPADGGEALAEAARRCADYQWVVFTSARAVERFVAALDGQRSLSKVAVAAIGEGTSAALARHGVAADIVPSRFVAEALVEAFPATEGAGRVLLPRAAVARDVLPAGLRRLGWEVTVVEAYRTRPIAPEAATRGRAERADAITFTSSSTLAGYLAFVDRRELPPVVASIGPVTTAAAQAAGVGVDVESPLHTGAGLAEALARYASALAGRPPRRRS